jgi:hypothetical protein
VSRSSVPDVKGTSSTLTTVSSVSSANPRLFNHSSRFHAEKSPEVRVVLALVINVEPVRRAGFGVDGNLAGRREPRVEVIGPRVKYLVG